MNWQKIEGNRWPALRPMLRKQWGRLTEADLDEIAGHRDRLLAKIQERYGLAREDAELALCEWEAESRRPR